MVSNPIHFYILTSFWSVTQQQSTFLPKIKVLWSLMSCKSKWSSDIEVDCVQCHTSISPFFLATLLTLILLLRNISIVFGFFHTWSKNWYFGDILAIITVYFILDNCREMCETAWLWLLLSKKDKQCKIKRMKWSTFTAKVMNFRNYILFLIPNCNRLVSSFLLVVPCDWVHQLDQSIRHKECKYSNLSFLQQVSMMTGPILCSCTLFLRYCFVKRIFLTIHKTDEENDGQASRFCTRLSTVSSF